MRRQFVAGNWKMNGSKASINTLLKSILNNLSEPSAEVAVFPPYVFLQQVQEALSASFIAWGAQDVSSEKSGAFTGEISADMLLEFSCRYVIVGHSERRALFQETNEVVAKKFHRATQSGLRPILCVGETLQQREAQQTEQIIQQQLESVLELAPIQSASALIAYEPVWAIGTGVNATPEQAQAVHVFIRQILAKAVSEEIANQIRIIYGGSVKGANAQSLFKMPDIDGGLVGGASLDAKEFVEIIKSCKH